MLGVDPLAYDQLAAGSTEPAFEKAFEGSVSFSGAMAKKTASLLTAALSFAGGFVASHAHALALEAAVLSFTGSTAKITRRSLAAASTFAGSLIAGHVHTLALEAALSFTGAISRKTKKSVSAALSFVGVIARIVGANLGAVLGFEGAFAKMTRKVFSGLKLLPSPKLFPSRHRFPAGADKVAGLSFSGSLAKRSRKVFSASVSPVGSFLRSYVRPLLLEGALSFAGVLKTRFQGLRRFGGLVNPFSRGGRVNPTEKRGEG